MRKFPRLQGNTWLMASAPDEGTVPNIDQEWQDRVRGMLRAELAHRGIGYTELAERLRAIGLEDSPKNLSNKIARGSFTAAFFFQCMEAVGCRVVRLDRED
jgi:hypothetical protein